jgi:GNAT superfamily N-acetyltransferase
MALPGLGQLMDFAPVPQSILGGDTVPLVEDDGRARISWRGIGKALMTAILEHPDVRDVARLVLVTDDAHALYDGFGFRPLDDVRKWMARRA